MDVSSLDEATRALGRVLGPRELAAVLGFDPLGVLTDAERRAVERIPFTRADLEQARADGEILVLRLPRDPAGPLTMVRLAERLGGGLDARTHRGVGYLLRDEWTIDDQPFATVETCAAGWWLVRRSPLPATCNRTYRDQDLALGTIGSPADGRPHRRSAIEIAWDTLCWQRAHGEHLLGDAWDWSRSETTDRGFAALGEYGPDGLRVIAYSRAVRFGTLGVCPQR